MSVLKKTRLWARSQTCGR
ncbi:hypothetical protein Hamer_G022602 [Homarus americanus]|uniref:Uncharacterized protein n=1 Tax=Homarus americanus TaxID=6706 RepID=A0A8J5JEP3_HOMAM|nr:hypothetical protein Hamer_G022602 [Homarus americanus]